MIPKIIHFVWVGGKPKPFVVRRCIASWRRCLAGYEIMEWNETNIDMNQNRYLREAYESRKWAFVSDVVRLKAVCDHGGIYLDSDCYVHRSLDPFLKHPFFTGFESPAYPFTAVFGATREHPLVRRLMQAYTTRKFILDDGKMDLTTNTVAVSNVLHLEYGCRLDGAYQELKEGVAIYPEHILCSYSKEGYVTHLMNYSWNNSPVRRFHRLLGGSGNAALLNMKYPKVFKLLTGLSQGVNDVRTRLRS